MNTIDSLITAIKIAGIIKIINTIIPSIAFIIIISLNYKINNLKEELKEIKDKLKDKDEIIGS